MSDPRRQTFAQKRERAAERRERRAAVSDPDVVMEAAAAFLAVRPRSVSETRKRLRHLGYGPAITDQVVDRLVAMDYLDDAAFARSWVESRDRARPRGASALRRELALKGVPREVVDGVLLERTAPLEVGADGKDAAVGAEALPPDRVAAERLLARKRASLLREPDPRKRTQKAYALLARNGFDPDICREVAATVNADVTLEADA